MELNNRFDIRPVKDLPSDKIIEVLTIALGKGNEAYKKSNALWQWKHLDSPFGPSYAYAAVDPSNSQIASVRTMMYWGFMSAIGETIVCARAVDISTHPDYRRMGIFSTLTEKALRDLTDQGIAMVYATPKLRGKSIGGYLKLGFEMIKPWPVFIKILRPISFIKGVAFGRGKIKTQFVPPWETVFSAKILTFSELSHRFNEEAISLFLEKADSNRNKVSGWRIKKDYNYIKWRYGSHPNVDYGFIPLIGEGTILGLGILRRNIRYGLTEVVISELLFFGEETVYAKRILKEIRKNISADYVIAHYNKGTSELIALKRDGYLKAPGQDIVFLIKELNIRKDRFDKQECWNLSIGDIELF